MVPKYIIYKYIKKTLMVSYYISITVKVMYLYINNSYIIKFVWKKHKK